MSVVVVANLHAKQGRADAVAAAFGEHIPAVHAEEGCELYALHRDGDQLVMIEKWASSEALDAHGKGSTMAAIGESLKGLMAAAPEVHRLDPLPYGGAKGAV